MLAIRKVRAMCSLVASQVAVFGAIRLSSLICRYRLVVVAMLYVLVAWRLARWSDKLSFLPGLLTHFLSGFFVSVAGVLVL